MSDRSHTMAEKTPAEAAAVMNAAAMGVYHGRPERGALRCALGDAAALCDAIARQIEIENRGRNGKCATTKQGRALAAIAKRCGDEIWEMRKGIWFDDEPLDPRI